MPADNEEITRLKPSASNNHIPNAVPTSSATTQTLGVTGRVMSYSSASSNVVPCSIAYSNCDYINPFFAIVGMFLKPIMFGKLRIFSVFAM
jgi:hypothetical protein